MQTENNGEAWYVNPADSKRYFLGRPADAFNVMRELGLGVSEDNFKQIAGEEANQEKPAEPAEPVSQIPEPEINPKDNNEPPVDSGCGCGDSASGMIIIEDGSPHGCLTLN